MEKKSEQSMGISHEDFKAQQRQMALNILKKAEEFITWDLKFNGNLSNLAEELVKQIKSNPRILESDIAIRDRLREMRAEKGQGPEGDIIGGGTFLEELWDILKSLIEDEKKFIQEIIREILHLDDE